MDLLATQWMIGLLGFAGGIAFGALIYHFTRSDEGGRTQIADDMQELQTHQQQYEEEVARHFARTAELVNNLTESYRDVHAHLAQGARSLCGDNEELRHQLENSLANRLIVQETETTPDEAEKIVAKAVEPPKDYAPKSGPQDSGTLSEDYGLVSGKKPKAKNRK